MAWGRKTSTEGRKTFKRTKTQGRGPGNRKAVRAWTKEASREGGFLHFSRQQTADSGNASGIAWKLLRTSKT